MVKNLSAIQETHVQSLGQKYPLEKGMLPALVFFPGEFHGQRRLAGYSPWDHKESDIRPLSRGSLTRLKAENGQCNWS